MRERDVFWSRDSLRYRDWDYFNNHRDLVDGIYLDEDCEVYAQIGYYKQYLTPIFNDAQVTRENRVRAILSDTVKEIDPEREYISYTVTGSGSPGFCYCEITNKNNSDCRIIFSIEDQMKTKEIEDFLRVGILKWILSDSFNEKPINRIRPTWI